MHLTTLTIAAYVVCAASSTYGMGGVFCHQALGSAMVKGEGKETKGKKRAANNLHHHLQSGLMAKHCLK